MTLLSHDRAMEFTTPLKRRLNNEPASKAAVLHDYAIIPFSFLGGTTQHGDNDEDDLNYYSYVLRYYFETTVFITWKSYMM